MRGLREELERVGFKHRIEGDLGLMPSPEFPFKPRDTNGRELEQFERTPDEDKD